MGWEGAANQNLFCGRGKDILYNHIWDLTQNIVNDVDNNDSDHTECRERYMTVHLYCLSIPPLFFLFQYFHCLFFACYSSLKAMVLCFKLYSTKDATICTTAAATVRQMVSVIFERVMIEDEQGLGKLSC